LMGEQVGRYRIAGDPTAIKLVHRARGFARVDDKLGNWAQIHARPPCVSRPRGDPRGLIPIAPKRRRWPPSACRKAGPTIRYPPEALPIRIRPQTKHTGACAPASAVVHRIEFHATSGGNCFVQRPQSRDVFTGNAFSSFCPVPQDPRGRAAPFL